MTRMSRNTIPTSTTCRRKGYQRWLYKYPQAEFPYIELVTVNRARSRQELEYELIDRGVFDGGGYFDVEVEHAKAGPEDIVCRVTVPGPAERERADA